MKLPVLEEMGDIAPALENLLKLQAEYARREPSVSRAMRDVAYKAVAAEIERYIIQRLSAEERIKDASHALANMVGSAGAGAAGAL